MMETFVHFPLPGLDLSKHAAFHAVGILGKEWIGCDATGVGSTGGFSKTPLVSVVVPFVNTVCILYMYIFECYIYIYV